ncbi:protein CLT2, chloroplastic isoform X2 [Nicotiana sylvestris]|uniref:Uncharacterized protein LOC104242494 isoform X2 n=1 Tax=Nicotiana sylvestris TaxID=4096 RepID=A0A1U7XY55_NICSY|nr:PREDICTED: uncharacterized protein LOC104242494 isoform X2 [Nicotiana sylvestris]
MESRSLTIRAKFPNHFHISSSLPRLAIINIPNPKFLFILSSSPMPLLTSSRRLQIHRRRTSFSRQFSNSSSKFAARAVGSDSNVTRELIILNSALTLVLGVANRVLYKLALVPMKEYPFFLAQVTTFGYLAIYLSILYARYHAGIVTDEMVAYPKSRFLLIGFLEALGVISGMYAGAMLPGPAIPILNQTFLVWQLALSVFILGRRYSMNQIGGCLLVVAGVVLAVTSGPDSNQMLAGIAFVWPVLMVASSAFQAAASVIKEFVFIDAASRLKGKVLDIFVVNSFGSAFQYSHSAPFFNSRSQVELNTNCWLLYDIVVITFSTISSIPAVNWKIKILLCAGVVLNMKSSSFTEVSLAVMQELMANGFNDREKKCLKDCSTICKISF